MSKWLRYYRIDICSPVKGTQASVWVASWPGAKLWHTVANGTLGEWFWRHLAYGALLKSDPQKVAVHRGSKQNPGEHQSTSSEIIWVQNPILNQIALCILVKTWTRTLEKGRRENSSIIALLLVQKLILMKTWVWINNNDTVVRILGISGSCSLIKTFSLNKFNHPLGYLLQLVKSDLTALLSWLLSRGTKENEKNWTL